MAHNDFAHIVYFLRGCYAGKNGENKTRREIKHAHKPAISASTQKRETTICNNVAGSNCLTSLLPKKANDNLVMTRGELRLQLPRQIVTLDFTTLLIKYFGTKTAREQLVSRHLSERHRPAPEAVAHSCEATFALHPDFEVQTQTKDTTVPLCHNAVSPVTPKPYMRHTCSKKKKNVNTKSSKKQELLREKKTKTDFDNWVEG